MTSVIAPPPPPPVGQPPAGHAVVRFAASLSGALDRLAQVPIWSMTKEEQREALVELRRQQSRLKELELRVLVQADRDGVGADSGAATSTPAWLAHATKTTTASCHRDLHLAAKLDERFHATREALAAGVIDAEKAAVIVLGGSRRSPPSTTTSRRHRGVRAEAHMLDLAHRVRRPHPAVAGQAAVRGGLPRGRRRGRGPEAGQGRGQGPRVGPLLGPRQRRRHQ